MQVRLSCRSVRLFRSGLTAAFGVVEELLLMISCPDAAPALAGLKFTFNLYVSPTASVTGRCIAGTG